MNISLRWLRAIAPTIEGSPRQIADRLGMLGAPVDELTELGTELGDVLVARVDEVRPHPHADRLRLCIVNAGGQPLQVVCGAPNVEAGRFYPFAPVGAKLPGGIAIRKAKLRGEASEGMLCSPRELGLGRDHAGLMMLTGEWEPGARLVDELEVVDVRLVLDITPNRPDLLSQVGVARELAPSGVADLELPRFGEVGSTLTMVAGDREAGIDAVRVSIEDPADCPRYLAAVIEGVRVGLSPEWLAMRLRAIGLRPINNIVDATNYVLHELGQPLHAFDLDRLAGQEVRVRRAVAGESLRTLDGDDRSLDENTLVIADRDRPVALAGVMGGEDSEVTAGTDRILLECALFNPKSVRRTARSFSITTDASQRFERGVDPEAQPRAVARVVDLIVATAGGSAVPAVVDLHPAATERTFVELRRARVAQVLGLDLEPGEIDDLLRPIGFEIVGNGEAVGVTVPAYRPDVTREIDVIEEIARRRGYDTFKTELRPFRPSIVPNDRLRDVQQAAHALFARWGFLEALTAAFAPAAEHRVPILNPLSAEESHLRDDLITGLLRRTEHNWAHGVEAVRLYQMGTVFAPRGAPIPHEEVRLAAVFTGPSLPPQWNREATPWDVWDMKALTEEVGGLVGATVAAPRADDRPVGLIAHERLELHSKDGETLGYGGRVDPGELDAPAWADPLWAIEVLLRPDEPEPARSFVPLPEFPPVDRDLALFVPAGMEAAPVEGLIRSAAGELLRELWPFDLYSGEGIPKGARSIAWRLRFRHPDRTLTDAEVDGQVARVVQALEEELGVRRR